MKSSLTRVSAVLCCAAAAQDQAARARLILSEPQRSASEAREALLALGDAAVDPVMDGQTGLKTRACPF